MKSIRTPAAVLIGVVATLTVIDGRAADDETVAVIGTGDMGDTLGPRLAGLGYRVVYGSRTPDSDRVKALVEATGHGASSGTPMEAAQRGDIVLLLVPWPAMEQVAQSLGNLDGKIVIDGKVKGLSPDITIYISHFGEQCGYELVTDV